MLGESLNLSKLDIKTNPIDRNKVFFVNWAEISFHCTCGCNIFGHYKSDLTDIYKCDSCGNLFLVE